MTPARMKLPDTAGSKMQDSPRGKMRLCPFYTTSYTLSRDISVPNGWLEAVFQQSMGWLSSLVSETPRKVHEAEGGGIYAL